MTKTSSQRLFRIRSASGVVGPFAPSARMRHFNLPAFFSLITRSTAQGASTSHFIVKQLVRIDPIAPRMKARRLPFFMHVLIGRLHVDAFRIVNRGGVHR